MGKQDLGPINSDNQPTEFPSLRTRFASLEWVEGGGGISPVKRPPEGTLPRKEENLAQFLNSRQYVGTFPAKAASISFGGWLSKFFKKGGPNK